MKNVSPSRRHAPASVSRQRGLASLVVVMVLFAIVAMVAAYTNRNLIFEQRTSLNQYRSTQALEAAEAGLEWAKAMLNGGRINDNCLPSASNADSTFRQRYLSIDAAGVVTAVANPAPPAAPAIAALTPACMRTSSGWTCSCPTSGSPNLTASGSDVSPAFRVRFISGTGQAGIVRIEVNACTRMDLAGCLNFSGTGIGNEGRVTVTELVGLASGIANPPLAALTVGGSIDLSGAALRLSNGDVASGGWTIQARGSAATAGMVLQSLPGTPAEASVLASDTSLPNGTNRMFATVFNMWPETYRDQPSAIVLDSTVTGCSATGCSVSAVRTAAAAMPGRPIWVAGDLAVDSAGDVGSTTAPVVLVVNGGLSFSGTGTGSKIFGAVYVRQASWSSSGSGEVHGALMADADITGNMTTYVAYNPDLLKLARLTTGSFVAVPGGWKDYCTGSITSAACP